MLNVVEISTIWELQESLPDGKQKELLQKMIMEYTQYTQLGTVSDCLRRKEIMSMSLEEIRIKFDTFVDGLRGEYQATKKESELYREELRKLRSGYKSRSRDTDGKWINL